MSYYAHQQQVIDESGREDRFRFGNWRGTGSGKTRTTVAIAEGITLVICPKTQADEKIWQKEWQFQGRPLADLVVLSKEQFKIKYTKGELHSLWPTTVIIDEAHTVAGVQPMTRQKNYIKYPRTSQLYDAVIGFLKEKNPKRIHPLTATPTANPMTVYALGTILGRQWDYFKFRDIFYFEKDVRGRKLFLANRSIKNKELIARTLQSIGYTGRLQDWFDVPDQLEKTHNVGVTDAQEKAYKELRLLYPDPLVQTGKRQMLEQGLFEGSLVAENKTEAIEQYLQEFGKVIVFARYTDQIEMYRKHFTTKKVKVFTLTGATKNRKEVIEEAQQSESCIFLAQCQISAGWELPDFPCMIFASLNYSFVDFDQAKGRILRANHLKKNLYVYLIAGDGDEKVKKAVANKEDFSEAMYAKQLCENLKLRSQQE